ncbi:TTK protein kinase [Pseudogymnoascus sp. 05NY08]|nr:TTK protein kinase [Pseudogymnoascus sp. 05NY08]
MATASPTPLGSSHFGNQQMRRPSSRQALRQVPPARPTFVRREAAAVAANGNPAELPTTSKTRRYSDHDSSDDDLPVPMKFSALTNALLNDEASMLGSASPALATNENNLSGSTAVAQRHTYTADPPAPDQMARERTASPAMVSRTHSPYPRRVVRLSGTPGSASPRRTTSLSNSVRAPSEQVPSRPGSPLDLSTPAPYPRTVRIPITASSNHGSSFGSSGRASNRIGSGSGARSAGQEQEEMEDPATVARPYNGTSLGSVTRYGNSTANRTRYGEETGMQSSMRVKRLGKAGSFLSGPARRGKRRQSEEEQGPGQDAEGAESAFSSQERQSQEPENQAAENHDGGSGEAASSQESEAPKSSFYSASQYRDFASGSPMSGREALKQARPSPPMAVYNRPAEPIVEQARPPPSENAPPVQPAQPVFKLPAPRPEMPSSHDQENEAPPTFKRNKAPPSVLLDKIDKVPLRPQSTDLSAMRGTVSPVRPPLAARSQNTPRRPAPPPPKMSLLETATATAGAATTSHSSKKRNNIRVNGKSYTRLEILGRGGSSKVWRVMAENGKIYALKRVSLEDADENAVRGYKGEIDLLKKLEGNDRVVTILDYEMNDEKQMLSVLMEMGELDFNRILSLRYNTENAVFDPSFTRYYWREMLVCIAAVHSHDIVHSDLKPANFVLVKGLLKLIDFGIANAIQTDETVNVHRDTQVGTPNYMSPESLMDSSELPENKEPGAMRGHHSGPRIMKLGKPSDIWSLGCILYQMAYGRQPFAHISNQLSRCRAIIDWNYAIEFPSRGLGGVTLPHSLIRLLKRCLERDQHKRPTAEELLSEGDEFLNPRELPEGALPMTEELLGRILCSVVGKCRGREVGEGEVMGVWAGAYFESLRKNLGA